MLKFLLPCALAGDFKIYQFKTLEEIPPPTSLE